MKLLNVAIILTGCILTIASVGAVFVVNAKRDTELKKAARIEAASRYKASIEACERGNVLRERINILIDGGPGDKIELVDCRKAIPQPSTLTAP